MGPRTIMIYGLFLAYSTIDLGIKQSNEAYPRKYREIRIYSTPAACLNAFANTCCPASQIIEAKDDDEFRKKVMEMHENFDNKEWLEECLYPYL